MRFSTEHCTPTLPPSTAQIRVPLLQSSSCFPQSQKQRWASIHFLYRLGERGTPERLLGPKNSVKDHKQFKYQIPTLRHSHKLNSKNCQLRPIWSQKNPTFYMLIKTASRHEWSSPPHPKSTPFLLKTNSQQPRICFAWNFQHVNGIFLNSVLYNYFSKMLSLYGRIKRQKQTLSSKQHSHLPYPQEINSWGGGGVCPESSQPGDDQFCWSFMSIPINWYLRLLQVQVWGFWSSKKIMISVLCHSPRKNATYLLPLGEANSLIMKRTGA